MTGTGRTCEQTRGCRARRCPSRRPDRPEASGSPGLCQPCQKGESARGPCDLGAARHPRRRLKSHPPSWAEARRPAALIRGCIEALPSQGREASGGSERGWTDLQCVCRRGGGVRWLSLWVPAAPGGEPGAWIALRGLPNLAPGGSTSPGVCLSVCLSRQREAHPSERREAAASCTIPPRACTAGSRGPALGHPSLEKGVAERTGGEGPQSPAPPHPCTLFFLLCFPLAPRLPHAWAGKAGRKAAGEASAPTSSPPALHGVPEPSTAPHLLLSFLS